MNKAQLVSNIASLTTLPQKDVESILEAYSQLILENVTKEEVPVPGIGNLVAKKQAARTAKNPQTGETVNVPERQTIKLRVKPSIRSELSRQ